MPIPTNFSAFETEISKIVDHLRDEFRYIKAGGINVEAVEDARVLLKTGGGGKGSSTKPGARVPGTSRRIVRTGREEGPKEVVRVRELCQVCRGEGCGSASWRGGGTIPHSFHFRKFRQR